MRQNRTIFYDACFTAVVLGAAFILNLLLDYWFDTVTLVPMIFVLGIFLISLKTQHIFWGIAGSFVSVLLVNYAFTYPYFGIDLVSPECIVSALVILDLGLPDRDGLELTHTEYNILDFLSQNTGKVLTYSIIIKQIWGYDDPGSVKKLQVNMANLRKKLGSRPAAEISSSCIP